MNDLLSVLKARNKYPTADNIRPTDNRSCGNCTLLVNTSGRSRRYTCRLQNGVDFDNDRRGDNVDKRYQMVCDMWEDIEGCLNDDE